MLGGIGMSELVVILVIALIFIGPKKLPEIARMLGKGMAEFRRTSDEVRNTITREIREADRIARSDMPAAPVVKAPEGAVPSGKVPPGPPDPAPANPPAAETKHDA